MNTDHTETPEKPYTISFFKNPSDKPLGTLFFADPMTFEGNVDESAKLFFETVVQQHSTALAQARTALATAMEERDEARKEVEKITELYHAGSEDRAKLIIRLTDHVPVRDQLNALRAHNAALTKALEAHHDHDLEVCEVHFKTKDGIDPIATDLGEAYADSQLCIDTVAALNLEPKSK